MGDRPDAVGTLETFAHPRSNARMLALANERGTPHVVDSGAFSVHSGAATIDVDDHARWVVENQTDAGPNVRFIGLDVLGDPVASYANWTRQRELGARVEPTLHYPEDPRVWLPKYLADGVPGGWVNLGGLVRVLRTPTLMDSVMGWAATAFKVAASHDVRFHGLGATHPDINARLPLDAVDSTYWQSPTRFRLLPLFDPTVGTWVKLGTMNQTPDGRVAAWRTTANAPRVVRTYGLSPRELVDADDALLVRLAVESHWRFCAYFRERHGTDLVCHLAGSDTLSHYGVRADDRYPS